MEAKERIILALDVDSEKDALALVEKLRADVGMFKVGMQLFNSAGPNIVRKIRSLGGKVFVDLKFHDIPNTVAAASRVVTRLGCNMFNVHASGGREMMKQCARAVQEEADNNGITPPAAIAVTVLTSLSQEEVTDEMHIAMPLDKLVVEWAMMARECGLSGVVASPQEVSAIRKACGEDFLIVTPGVRPAWSEANDQKRFTTPRQALELGSSYLVIGRPITKADDSIEAAKKISQELEG